MKTSLPLIAAIVSAVTIAVSATGGYHLLQKVFVPGDDGWDYYLNFFQQDREVLPVFTNRGLQSFDIRNFALRATR